MLVLSLFYPVSRYIAVGTRRILDVDRNHVFPIDNRLKAAVKITPEILPSTATAIPS